MRKKKPCGQSIGKQSDIHLHNNVIPSQRTHTRLPTLEVPQQPHDILRKTGSFGRD